MQDLFKNWDGDLLFMQTLPQLHLVIDREEDNVIDAHHAYPDGKAGGDQLHRHCILMQLWLQFRSS